MSKVKILFFAADPLSAPPDGHAARLLLDEDIRQIREKVRASEHRDAFEFDWRLVARPDDLLQALNEVQPDVVHFSGHGWSDGLVLMDPGRRPHGVGSEALRQLFQACRGNIQVVVLNASSSLPQAEAIAGAVGCAIGVRGEISDAAAITFGASFYRAIGFGESVRAAYDQARAALALEHFEEREYPQLLSRPGVDPARLFLISPGKVDVGVREMVGAAWSKVVGTRGQSLPPTPPPAPPRKQAGSKAGGDDRRSTVFISYSHKDRKWLERLQIHLKPLEREGLITLWDDTLIKPGTQWKAEIRRGLESARVAVLLISADFLASDYVRNNELPPLLAAARAEGAIILPLILSPCRFVREESLAKFQAVNDPARPLNTLPKAKQEEALNHLSEVIERAMRS